MKSIIIQSLSSCSICENLFWETRGKLRFVIFSFYLWCTQWQNASWTSLHLQHVLFLFLGITHTEQASIPRKKCSKGPAPAPAAGFSAVRTLTWAPTLTLKWRVLREQERIITWSAGLGPFFWNEHQHSQFSYEALTKPPFQTCLFLAKQIQPGQWQGKKSSIKEMRQLSFSPWPCCFLVLMVAFLLCDKGSVNYASLGPGCWWFTDCTSLAAPPHLLLWN